MLQTTYIRAASDLVRRSISSWTTHECYRLGAAIAFYSLLSISPLVILAFALAAFVFDQAAAQTFLASVLQEVIGSQGSAAAREMLEKASEPSSSAVTSAMGVATLMFGASAVFAELEAALNKIWDTGPLNIGTLWTTAKTYFLSVGMVFSFGLLLLLSLTLEAAVAVMDGWLAWTLHLPLFALATIRFLLSLGVTSAMFALTFRYIPRIQSPWTVVLTGGVVTAVLFTLGKMLIGLYVSRMGIGSAYGAAGSTVVFMVWVYYSAMIFLFGAEVTHELFTKQNQNATPSARLGPKPRRTQAVQG